MVVIGGEGFYGARVVRALRERGYDVTVAGRPPASDAKPVAIDLIDPTTFEPLREFDLIVAIADSVSAPSDALISWVDRSGGRLVEASAFAPFYRRAIARVSDTNATIVLGAGVFPGASTALALSAAAELEKDAAVEQIDIAVRISPFSGAGWGNSLLMARMLALPSFEWVDDARQERPTVGRSKSFTFTGGSGTAAQVDLPDVELVRLATRSPGVTAWMALRPSWLLINFRILAWIVAHAGPFRRVLLALTHWQLAFLRGLVLRDRTTRVEITAEAHGFGESRIARREFDDGFEATAAGVADAVDAAFDAAPGWHVAGEITPP